MKPSNSEQCPRCEGRGWLLATGEDCPNCNGWGYVEGPND